MSNKKFSFSISLSTFALLILQSFAPADSCKAQNKYANDGYIVFMEGDTLRGRILSAKNTHVAIDNGQQAQEFLAEKVYRVYDLRKNKVYAPTFLAKSSEPMAGARPGYYRVKTEKLKAPTFAQLLEDGEIAVYYFSNTNLGIGGGASIFAGSGGGGILPSIALNVSKTKLWLAIKKKTDEIIVLKSSNADFYVSDNDKANNLINLMDETPNLQEALVKERKVNFKVFMDYIKQYNTLVPSPNKEEKLIF